MATSATLSNRRVLFTKVPVGFPVANQDMMMETRTINPSSLPSNSVLLKNLFLSLDPYMRGRMRPQEAKSYSPPFTLGDVMTGGGVGEVYFSSHPDFKQGDLISGVSGMIGWEEFTLLQSPNPQEWIKLPRDAKSNLSSKNTKTNTIPLSYYVGVLGMPGMTAWVGVNKIIKRTAREGQTLLISAAAGAVGQLVAQLAKLIGLKVVGSVGSDDKVEYLLRELKFDGAFNYKKVPDLDVALSQYCPSGIDFYWENVGGETLEKVLDHCNNFATIVACGMISQYNTTTPYGVKNLMQIVSKRLNIQGFLVFDHIEEQQNFQKEVSDLIKQGKIIYKEDISVGIESAQEAFLGMLRGKNFGKTVVQIDQNLPPELPKTQ